MTRSGLHRLVLTSLLASASCASATRPATPTDDSAARAEIVRALESYLVAARAVDASAIAAHFTPTGVLLEPGIFPIEGSAAIREFIASFPGVQVDVATATPDTIEVFGGTAFLWGSYFERLAFPGQPVSEQHGRFVIEWKRQSDRAWAIERFYRVPLPAEPPAAR